MLLSSFAFDSSVAGIFWSLGQGSALVLPQPDDEKDHRLAQLINDMQITHILALPLLYNEYGPTEGTVWSTVYKVPRDWAGAMVPIGRPIVNMQLYLLDQHRQPVPVGVPGELYIGGTGITPGYLKRPALTAGKFVPHPFDEHAQTQLYRTGDVARYLPDGNIEFLGRSDEQVKLRGFRIERLAQKAFR